MDNDDIIVDNELQKSIDDGEYSTNYIYLPYSYWRIKEVFLSMGFEMRPYFTGYKAMRYRSCQNWVLIDIYDNTVFGSEYGYTLEELRYVLAKLNVPLHKEKVDVHTTTRNKGAMEFLKIFNSIDDTDVSSQVEEKQGDVNE